MQAGLLAKEDSTKYPTPSDHELEKLRLEHFYLGMISYYRYRPTQS